MNWPYTRVAAGSGVLFVVLFNVALFAPGPPPRASDSASRIAETLVADRDVIQAGMVIAGLATIFGLFFVAGVTGWLTREARASDAPLAWAGAGGGLIAMVLGVIGMALFFGAAFEVAGEHELAAVRGLTDAGNAMIEMSKFGFACLVGAVALVARRAELLPRWLTAGGLGAAGLGLVSTVPLFAEGSFTEFGGGLDLIGAAPFVLWLLVLSVVLTRRATR
jgi:hypothetical protein